jgi:hypothetical protein
MARYELRGELTAFAPASGEVLRMRTWTTVAPGLLLGAVLVGAGAPPRHAAAEQPPAPAAEERRAPALKPDRFAALHELIKPQAGELRFHEIPWLLDVWEARKAAAAEGKPILVWSGAGGAPIGVC